MARKSLKLTIEPTISVSVFDLDNDRIYSDSLASQLSLSAWRKIKNELFEREGKVCWICGAKGVSLHAHEFWRYTPKGKYYKHLTAIHHLCQDCHSVKHADVNVLPKQKVGQTDITTFL